MSTSKSASILLYHTTKTYSFTSVHTAQIVILDDSTDTETTHNPSSNWMSVYLLYIGDQIEDALFKYL